MAADHLTDADREQLRARGIALEEARRQLDLLASPPVHARLVRPATVGDGIESVPDAEVPELLGRHVRAAAAGRLLWFVPASGAATRMFRDLAPFVRGGSATRSVGQAEAARQLLEGLPRLPFFDELRAELARRGLELDRLVDEKRVGEILAALLDRDGLGLADLPKGLVPFHRYADAARTAFEEHLVEAASVVRNTSGRCRLHFTVSPEHLSRFQALLVGVRGEYERRLGVRLEVGFSEQSPTTDTLAVELDGRPLRDGSGRLVFRPAGHGALLENLSAVGGDLVLIKNVDNVARDRFKEIADRWKALLVGRLLGLEKQVREHLAAMDRSSPDPERLAGALEFLHLEIPSEIESAGAEARRAFLIETLDRPLRVCGVVRNTGEPGGGPFWVRGRDGRVSLQIVEGAQVDPGSPEQQEILRRSTHFNPVDMVCALRDRAGRPHDLRRFADPEAVIVAKKSWEGRPIVALERPGLWNGGMAGWVTVFVEVPLETFNPVKTVLDLLRPEHQV